MFADAKQSNVKVVCRFRPLNEKEKSQGAEIAQELLDDKTVVVRDSPKEKAISSAEPPKFTFDRVFDCGANQETVYTYAASSVVEGVLEGFNGTIFAYGQTSSGKTHTMEGELSNKIVEQSGIIPRVMGQIFDTISRCS
jgi:kinesin family protein 5